VGIPKGKALIYRNIAAMVGVSSPERASESATLEFAVNVMKVKHIIIMGHTDCGGIRACMTDSDASATRNIRHYLQPLNLTRQYVMSQGGDVTAQARAMEQAAVRQSISNVLSYPAVVSAFAEGRVLIHGWVINTASKKVKEFDYSTGLFLPMRPRVVSPYHNQASSDNGEQEREREREQRERERERERQQREQQRERERQLFSNRTASLSMSATTSSSPNLVRFLSTRAATLHSCRAGTCGHGHFAHGHTHTHAPFPIFNPAAAAAAAAATVNANARARAALARSVVGGRVTRSFGTLARLVGAAARR
jgi:carbonic anhydrase